VAECPRRGCSFWIPTAALDDGAGAAPAESPPARWRRPERLEAHPVWVKPVTARRLQRLVDILREFDKPDLHVAEFAGQLLDKGAPLLLRETAAMVRQARAAARRQGELNPPLTRAERARLVRAFERHGRPRVVAARPSPGRARGAN
jgi:hypothetical protein